MDNYTCSVLNESRAVLRNASVGMNRRKHRVVSINREVRSKVIG